MNDFINIDEYDYNENMYQEISEYFQDMRMHRDDNISDYSKPTCLYDRLNASAHNWINTILGRY